MGMQIAIYMNLDSELTTIEFDNATDSIDTVDRIADPDWDFLGLYFEESSNTHYTNMVGYMNAKGLF